MDRADVESVEVESGGWNYDKWPKMSNRKMMARVGKIGNMRQGTRRRIDAARRQIAAPQDRRRVKDCSKVDWSAFTEQK
jgi:hypothetical protein